jgi:hypothetical protein
MKQIALPAVILLVLVSLATVALWPSASVDADHYRRFRDGQTLYSVLHTEVEPGSAVQDVEKLLGAGVPVTDGVEAVRAGLKQLAIRYHEHYPDGVYETDTFLEWPAGEDSVTLQFRNGWLMNHDPSQFAQYRPKYAVAGYETVPSGPPVSEIAGRSQPNNQRP